MRVTATMIPCYNRRWLSSWRKTLAKPLHRTSIRYSRQHQAIVYAVWLRQAF
jgi:hypothetical protein